jgi:hypothetical protein
MKNSKVKCLQLHPKLQDDQRLDKVKQTPQAWLARLVNWGRLRPSGRRLRLCNLRLWLDDRR